MQNRYVAAPEPADVEVMTKAEEDEQGLTHAEDAFRGALADARNEA